MSFSKLNSIESTESIEFVEDCLCSISVARVKCGIHSTLCCKIGNISGSTKLFGL